MIKNTINIVLRNSSPKKIKKIVLKKEQNNSSNILALKKYRPSEKNHVVSQDFQTKNLKGFFENFY